MGLFGFLDKLIDKLPIQGRVERWKNEVDDLQEERTKLEWRRCSEKESKRIADINTRLDELHRLLKNKAQ